ncbi:ENV2 protein, partial [Syrrhaptes paradoxus]|nr:ENV2 protein [Syrrhaptes paradoxus]
TLSGNNMWKVINASYLVLNQTNPRATERCWLCFSIRPPYYEAISDLSEPIRTNESDPPQCNWGKDVGVTLTQVAGRGRCIG